MICSTKTPDSYRIVTGSTTNTPTSTSLCILFRSFLSLCIKFSLSAVEYGAYVHILCELYRHQPTLRGKENDEREQKLLILMIRLCQDKSTLLSSPLLDSCLLSPSSPSTTFSPLSPILPPSLPLHSPPLPPLPP